MFRALLRYFWWTLATLIICTALVITAARLLFPYVEDYRSEVENQVSLALEYPVRIQSLHARWRGLSPQVILSGVTLLDTKQDKALLTIEEIQANLDLWQTLWRQQLTFGTLTALTNELHLIRDSDGNILLPGYHPDDEPVDTQELARWLLHQEHLGLRIRQFTLRDDKLSHHYRLADVVLDLHNNNNHHQLDGSLSLNGPKGQSIALNLSLNGNLIDSGQWHSTVKFKGMGISPQDWFLTDGMLSPLRLARGRYDINLTAQINTRKLTSISGTLAGHDIQLGRLDNPALFQLNQFSTRIDWQHLADHHWQLTLNDTRLSRPGRSWPLSHFKLNYQQLATDPIPQIAAEGSYLDLHDVTDGLLTLLPPEQAQRSTLAGLKPAGKLHHWQLHSNASGISASLRFNDLITEAWQDWPGIANLSGELSTGPQSGKLTLNSPQARLNWPTLFRNVIEAERLQGTVRWQKQPDGWQVSGQQIELSNNDISTRTGVVIKFPDNAKLSPQLDIITDFQHGDASKISRYLPVAIMAPDVVNWLDQGIISGHVPHGRLTLKGSAHDFPYPQGNGRFEVAFDVEKVRLQPEPGWPVIDDIDARIRFFGNSMEINADRASVYRNSILSTRVAIANMAAPSPLLAIDGSASGPTTDKLRFLIDSPLKEQFQTLSQTLMPSGNSLLKLALVLDLGHHGDHHVAGNLNLQNNRLRIPDAPLDVTNVNGEIAFSDNGIRARGISAILYRHPFIVDISQPQGRGGKDILIEAHGKVDAEGLQQHFKHPIFRRFTGTSAAEARLLLPHDDTTTPISLAISSPLTGMSIDLLAPFNKSGRETRKLSVRSEFGSSLPNLLFIDYGDLASGAFQIGKDRVERGQLVFGRGTPRIPDQPGLIISGRFNRLSVSEWQAMLDQAETLGGTQENNGNLFSSLRSIDLQIDRFEFMQQQFDKLKLTATRMAEQWLIRADSPQLQGKITLQDNLLKHPVTMELDYWHLAGLPSSPGPNDDGKKSSDNGADFGTFPSLQISCKSFSYNNRPLGKLELTGRRRDNGYHIERLELNPAQTRITLQGYWNRNSRGELTQLDASVNTRDAGKTMAALGYTDTIRNGEGQVQINAQWPGSPIDPDITHTSGKLDFKLRNGRLLDVDSGAGRALGIFSLQALPRRLSLDFSDLFGKGMSFDKIEGNFDIINGIASTNNLVMESPSARIDISGKVDLVRQRYDQRALITPYATESLPLLGALTAATPQIGAAIFLAQQLFKKALRKLTQFEYSITGPWADPTVEKVEQKPNKSAPVTQPTPERR